MNLFRNKISQGSKIADNNVVGTVTGFTYKDDTDIGIVLQGISGNSAVWLGAVASVKVIIIPIKASGNCTLIKDNATAKLEISGGSIAGTGLTNCYISNRLGNTKLRDTNVVSFGRWQLIIAEYSGGISFATDVRYSIDANCELGEVIMLDAIPSNYYACVDWFHKLYRRGFKKTNLLDREIFNSKATKDIRTGVVHYSLKQGSLLDIGNTGKHVTATGFIPTTKGGFFINDGSGASLNIGTHRSIQLTKVVGTTDYFFDLGGGVSISVTAGTVVIGGTTGTIWVNGALSSTIPTTNKLYTIQIVFDANVAISGFTLNRVGLNYGTTEWLDLIFSPDTFDIDDAKFYHNDFANLNTLYDRTEGEAVGNPPRDWRKGTATSLTVEEITNSSCNLPVGTKYIKIGTATKTCYIENNEMTQLVSNGYADYWYYTAATNQFVQRTGLIGVVAGLSYASGRLTFTAAANGDGFAASYPYELKIKAGVQV